MDVEVIGGLTQVFFMDKLAQLDDVSDVANELKILMSIVGSPL